jgi:hypothetical protein
MIALLCVVGVGASSAAGWTITVRPNEAASKDAFAYQFLPTFNFDSGPFGSLLSAGATGIGHDTRSLVQFDLSSVNLTPAQVAAPSFHATFQIYVDSTAEVGFGADPSPASPIQVDLTAVGGATPAWSESAVTWNSQPTVTGGVASTATINGINQWVSFDVTSLVQQWLNGSLANNGFMLTEDAIVGTDPNFVVGVFDSSAGPNAPLLSIVPEPASVLLALAAVPWLAWRWRRRVVREARR